MAPRNSGLLRCTAASSLAFLGAGILVVLAGLIVPAAVQSKLHDGIREAIIWTPASPPETDARFRSNAGPDAPADTFKVWMFNITNIDEVRQGGLPKLEQVGPYVHRAYHEKLDVLWDANGRVYFKDYTHFHLDPELSEADPAANITTFNLALLGVLANLHGSVAPEYRPFLDVLMQAISSYMGDPGVDGVFTTRPAMELLWGYEDALLQLLQALLPPGTLADGAKVRLLRNASSPEEVRARAPNVFNTGQYDPGHIWNAEADQGRCMVTSWPCDPEAVRGSDASQFQPGLAASDAVEVFIADLFQARRLVVNSSVDLHGVELLRFWLDPAQGEPNPCRDQEVRGLMNITTPQAAGFNRSSQVTGPYVFVSMPMFCGADERLAQEAGLVCDEERHQTWVDVEPTTGITMRVYKRLMMSSRVGELAAVLDPHVRTNLTIPMFWAEEAVAATPQLAAQLRGRLYTAKWVVQHLGKLCWICGGLLLLLGVLLAVLTVELAADPDKWGDPAVASLMASAQHMFGRRSGDTTASSSGGAGSASGGGRAAAAARPSGAAEAGLRQPLLGETGGGERAGQQQEGDEIVAG